MKSNKLPTNRQINRILENIYEGHFGSCYAINNTIKCKEMVKFLIQTLEDYYFYDDNNPYRVEAYYLGPVRALLANTALIPNTELRSNAFLLMIEHLRSE